MIRRMRAVLQSDRGSNPVSFVLSVPLFVLFLWLVIVAGRLTSAEGTVQSAANEAARAASIARTASEASSSATAAAQMALTGSSIDCTNTTATASTGGINAALGQTGTVSVTVTCRVPLSDLGLPISGSRSISATGVSVVDAYRERG